MNKDYCGTDGECNMFPGSKPTLFINAGMCCNESAIRSDTWDNLSLSDCDDLQCFLFVNLTSGIHNVMHSSTKQCDIVMCLMWVLKWYCCQNLIIFRGSNIRSIYKIWLWKLSSFLLYGKPGFSPLQWISTVAGCCGKWKNKKRLDLSNQSCSIIHFSPDCLWDSILSKHS